MKKVMLLIVLSFFVVGVVYADEVDSVIEPVNEVEVIDDSIVTEAPNDVVDDEVDNSVEVTDEKEETKEEEKKEEVKNDKKPVSIRDIMSLIISFLVLGVVIGAGIFAYKENKSFSNK